ncbi:MAG: hypothetical protein KMY54_08455, partial [Erysipelothrix sp.]|nr:hypothetical protein [Erysipelothrix sp.]
MNWKWPRLTSCLRITLALLLSIMAINPISVSATGYVDLTRDPEDITLNKTAVVEDAVWIRIDNGDPDDDATGTGYFNSFLRLQKTNGEIGYNSNLKKTLFDELESFTDAELLEVVPFVEYEGIWYREFQLDINQNNDYLILNRLQIWVTEHENLTESTYPGGVHTFTQSDTVKVYDTGDNVIMLSYRGGSGNREYKVLVPAEDFPEKTYVVIYTEMGFPSDAVPDTFEGEYLSNDGFEEWGVKVMTELPPTIDVVKTAMVTSVPEPGDWVTYKVDIANSSGMSDPVTINSLTDAIEGGMAYSISGMIFDDMALTIPTVFPFTIQPGTTKTVYFEANVTGEPRTVNNIVTASGVDDEGSAVSDYDDADVVIINATPVIDVTKTAMTTELYEPGDWVTYKVDIKNNSVSTDPVTINTLTDKIGLADAYDISGLIFDEEALLNPTTFPFTIQPGETKTVYFKAEVKGDPRTVNNVVTASGVDDEGTAVSDYDDADVLIKNVDPVIDVTKTALTTELFEPGDWVTYKVDIKNNSVSTDPVTINSLTDAIDGALPYNISGMIFDEETLTTLTVFPFVIEPDDTKTVYFKVYVSGDPRTVNDIVTASGVDDEGTAVSDYDDADVLIKNVDPEIDVTKTALTTELFEPGGWVTYKVDIKNNSVSTDPVTINALTDAIEGGTAYSISGKIYDEEALTTLTVFPFVIEPGDTKTVYFKAEVKGDPRTVNDIVTASGVDDEGTAVSDYDDADVVVNDVLPDVTIT